MKNKKNNSKVAQGVSFNIKGVRVPTFKSFADAVKRCKLKPSEILAKFHKGEIAVEPFSRHPRLLAGSAKVGRYVESALFDGANKVVIDRKLLVKIYDMDFGKIK